MKPTQFAYACSMKLGDNPEQARERYESLKEELIKMGYGEEFKNSWNESDQIIVIDNRTSTYGSRIAGGHCAGIHGPLIPTFNRSLFLAIAGQEVGGCVGCWYSNGSGHTFRFVREEEDDRIVIVEPNGVWSHVDKAVLRYTHLATIAELIEAFPNEDSEDDARQGELTAFEQKVLNETFKKSLRSEPTLRKPEPLKIKKGDNLLCVDEYGHEITKGYVYTAMSDQYDGGLDEEVVTVTKDNGHPGTYRISRFTIANEEPEPVKEDTKLNMGGMSETRGADGYDGPMTGFEVFEDDEDDGPKGEPIPERADIETLIIQGGGLTFKITPIGIYCGNKDVTKLLNKVVNEQSHIQIMPF